MWASGAGVSSFSLTDLTQDLYREGITSEPLYMRVFPRGLSYNQAYFFLPTQKELLEKDLEEKKRDERNIKERL